MFVFALLACGVVLSEGFIVCPPNSCDNAKCPDLSGCKGTVKTNGGFCGCCDSCVDLLGEHDSCTFLFLMGVPAGRQCGPGLTCSPSTHTCVSAKRQVAQGSCVLKQQQLNKQHGSMPLLGQQNLRCNNDGSYSPVQCLGSVCYCVDRDGVEINGFRTNAGAHGYTTMNCQCARDKASSLSTGLLGQTFTCETNGNYQQYQCRGSVCFCVDDNGVRLGTATVGIGQLASLKC